MNRIKLIKNQILLIIFQALLENVDMINKRRQVLRHIQDLGLSPYHEEKLRRVLLSLHPILSKNQVRIDTKNKNPIHTLRSTYSDLAKY